ncbi:hypothetical protein EVAR_7894_1 [Eumeta japonica]|uniref:Uncharacterized protein n=1 Tax=Eumeta variegata TaxID=151549 RepID=A0A4C1TV39_EUMVA|nr:hypothetical protein EVAR_7894_1 [Eumeta japonica]
MSGARRESSRQACYFFRRRRICRSTNVIKTQSTGGAAVEGVAFKLGAEPIKVKDTDYLLITRKQKFQVNHPPAPRAGLGVGRGAAGRGVCSGKSFP